MRTRNNKSAFRLPVGDLLWSSYESKPFFIIFIYLYVLFNSVQVSKPQFLRVDIQNNDRVATAGRPCWKLQMIVLQAPKNVVLDMAAIAPWIASTNRTARHRGTSIDHWETMVERYESPSSISSGGTLTKEIIRRETPGSIWILGNKDSKVALFETRCHWICREFWLIEENRFYHSSALPHNAHVSLQEMYSQYLQCLSILFLVCFVIHPTNQAIGSISLLSRGNVGQFISILMSGHSDFHLSKGWQHLRCLVSYKCYTEL